MQTPKHNPKWVIIGRIGRTHGVKGDLLLNIYSDSIKEFAHFYIFDDEWQKLELEHISNSKIKIKNIDSPENAKLFTNKYLAVPRKHLPKLNTDEFYWHDLIGMKVINQDNHLLGTVQEISDYGAHPNIIIYGERQYIIPMTNEIIISKDFNAGSISVIWDVDD